ncbi:hypothetical protein [Lichenibacterium dinghuense]|uniref:hypothetical protein n=1 Tax=Lichenibacterium dinghuense TaxID=2895977 RepID=UPI001F35F819|nr:hypothetical protein [Lichenibacterium sp. 6Y81]
MNSSGLAHLARVVAPALHLAPTNFVEEIAARLAEAGVQDAVARHDPGPIYDWLIGLVALQGISDDVAFGWDERHGGARWAEVDGALRTRPSCPRLRSYWDFAADRGCGYRKGLGTCAEPGHLLRCPLPRPPLRKGGLNQSAFHLALFFRDVCGGDLVGWLDARLAEADLGRGAPDRSTALGIAVSEPLAAVTGIGRKLASMALAELLLAGDPDRERWVAAGAGMVAVDSLVHNFLHRTGTLHRCGAKHAYGPACYAPGGCADLLRALADAVDARHFNPAWPRSFPRWIQHSIWAFCATGGLDVCNGNRVDDCHPCRLRFCPTGPDCDRVALRSATLA